MQNVSILSLITTCYTYTVEIHVSMFTLCTRVFYFGVLIPDLYLPLYHACHVYALQYIYFEYEVCSTMARDNQVLKFAVRRGMRGMNTVASFNKYTAVRIPYFIWLF